MADEKSVPATSRLALAVVGLAGFTDGVSYLQFRRVYVSFMSGNTTALGVAAARGHWPEVQLLAPVLGLFVAGVVLGSWLRRAGSRRPAALVLAVVAGLLAAAAAGPLSLGLLALSMGMLNAAVHQTGRTVLSLTYVTGTLVKLGAGLADRLSGRRWPADWGRQALDWLCLAAGAVAGALAWQVLGLRALLVAAAGAALLALAAR
ncbi:MAG: YoaK family protein [Janthinobacterium lividum]